MPLVPFCSLRQPSDAAFSHNTVAKNSLSIATLLPADLRIGGIASHRPEGSPPLSTHFSPPTPGIRRRQERLSNLEIHPYTFIWPEEKLEQHPRAQVFEALALAGGEPRR
jgi:hypothetical protein